MQIGETYPTKQSGQIEAFLCYKDFKESIIKAMAQKYKNHIDSHVYDAMIAYRVEITD